MMPGTSGCAGTRSESAMPNALTGTARTTPASGPAAAMSNSTLRFGMNGDMRITAPIVPKSIGIGMK